MSLQDCSCLAPYSLHVVCSDESCSHSRFVLLLKVALEHLAKVTAVAFFSPLTSQNNSVRAMQGYESLMLCFFIPPGM